MRSKVIIEPMPSKQHGQHMNEWQGAYRNPNSERNTRLYNVDRLPYMRPAVHASDEQPTGVNSLGFVRVGGNQARCRCSCNDNVNITQIHKCCNGAAHVHFAFFEHVTPD